MLNRIKNWLINWNNLRRHRDFMAGYRHIIDRYNAGIPKIFLWKIVEAHTAADNWTDFDFGARAALNTLPDEEDEECSPRYFSS